MDQTSESEKQLQRTTFNNIIDVLIGAGYHRARINTLSEFDKVVGGLCWCITSSGEDVDVDILFTENSTIGERITLSEAIVMALRKMNCPSPLQPHQIQGGIGGSDFPSIQPVIVWLVKKFFERRIEREKQLRLFASFQFDKNYEFPTSAAAEAEAEQELEEIKNKTKAIRLYRRKEAKGESEETRVHSCLLEYGEKGSSAGAADSSSSSSSSVVVPLSSGDDSQLSGFERKLMQAAKQAMKEDELLRQNSTREEAELMQQMKEVEGGVVSGASIGAIVGLSSGEIGSAAAQYEHDLDAARQQLESSLGSGKLGQLAAYKRQRQHLIKTRDELESKATEVAAAVAALEQRLHILEDEVRGAVDYNSKLGQQLGKLADLEAASSQQEELATLKSLVILNETLKGQEAAFKASCKAQLADYTARIKALEEADAEDAESAKQLRDIEDMHAKVLAKYNRLRQLLAETNLEIASNVRIIDDVPTRTELIQYERRFAELYQQVAWKLVETKKYFAMYNQYDSTLSFLQKEIKLLNSISENFSMAMRSAQGKEEYLKQFELILKGVESSLKAQESLLAKSETQTEDLKQTNQNLVDEQRRYFQAVKDFQIECSKNEWLESKLLQLKQERGPQ
jgi:hypothetical protein